MSREWVLAEWQGVFDTAWEQLLGPNLDKITMSSVRTKFAVTMYDTYGIVVDPITFKYNVEDETKYTMFLLKHQR